MITSPSDNAAAIALNRFGLGARPDDSPPPDPKAWLLAQFEQYQPLPAAWAGQPTAVALATQLGEQRQQNASTNASTNANANANTDPAASEAMAAFAVERYGRLDVLHNNVGVGAGGNTVTQTLDDWNRLLATNLTSAMLCCRSSGAIPNCFIASLPPTPRPASAHAFATPPSGSRPARASSTPPPMV